MVLCASLIAYLSGTLSATGLSKLRHRRSAAIGMLREDVLPDRLVPLALLSIGTSEVIVAAALAFNVQRVVALWVTVALFLVFSAYHVAVALRTRSVVCSCVGTSSWGGPASLPAVAGTCFGCWLSAGCAMAVLSASGETGGTGEVVIIVAWLVPPAAWAFSGIRRLRTVPAEM